MIGIGIGVNKIGGGGAGAGFSPAALFANGEAGAWYDPSPETCFTDVAGTTAAGEGDAVARVNDLSGNANHATQATVAARPTLEKTAGGLWYLDFDGDNDTMETASIDFSGTDKMSVFAGVLKSSDASTATLVNSSGANGGFELFAPALSGSQSYRYSSFGTSVSNTSPGSVAPAPDTAVISGISDISGDSVILRQNGNQIAVSLVDQGSGNYSDAQVHFSARGGSLLFFTGRLYSIIVRGALTSGDTLADTEAYVASKTGVTL